MRCNKSGDVRGRESTILGPTLRPWLKQKERKKKNTKCGQCFEASLRATVFDANWNDSTTGNTANICSSWKETVQTVRFQASLHYQEKVIWRQSVSSLKGIIRGLISVRACACVRANLRAWLRACACARVCVYVLGVKFRILVVTKLSCVVLQWKRFQDGSLPKSKKEISFFFYMLYSLGKNANVHFYAKGQRCISVLRDQLGNLTAKGQWRFLIWS